MSMPNFPIEIKVRLNERPQMGFKSFIVRAETRCNGVPLFYEDVIDDRAGCFEYDPFSGQVYVRNQEMFTYFVEMAKCSLMDHISESYQPRFAVGG